MIQMVLIGSGNLDNHLITAFAKSTTVDLIQVFARKKQSVTPLFDESKITSNYSYELHRHQDSCFACPFLFSPFLKTHTTTIA